MPSMVLRCRVHAMPAGIVTLSAAKRLGVWATRRRFFAMLSRTDGRGQPTERSEESHLVNDECSLLRFVGHAGYLAPGRLAVGEEAVADKLRRLPAAHRVPRQEIGPVQIVTGP